MFQTHLKFKHGSSWFQISLSQTDHHENGVGVKNFKFFKGEKGFIILGAGEFYKTLFRFKIASTFINLLGITN
jgi:hypothetical protein